MLVDTENQNYFSSQAPQPQPPSRQLPTAIIPMPVPPMLVGGRRGLSSPTM